MSYEVLGTEEDLRYLRNNFSPGNINPQSQYLGRDEYFNSLFYTDRPNHVIFCHPSKITFVSTSVLKTRGVRVINYDTLITYDVKSENQRANHASYFLGSVDQPYTPYIMVTSTTNPVALSYFRRFGLTFYSYEGYASDLCDYSITDDNLKDTVTKPIYLAFAPSTLEIDRNVGPKFVMSEYHNYLQSLVPRLCEHLHTEVELRAYGPALKRNNITLFHREFQMYDTHYALSTFEGIAMLESNVKREIPRKFVIAPSGSGKTHWVRFHDYAVDMDTLFHFPPGLWWKNPLLRDKVDADNARVLVEWLSGPKDGKIGLYADDLGMKPDGIIKISEVQHAENLMHVRKNQPGIKDLKRIRDNLEVMIQRHAHVPVFDTFQEAMSAMLANGRLRMPFRNRYSNMFYFHITKRSLGWEIQTYKISQTWIVKSITYALSRLLNLGDKDMEVPRRRALERAGGFAIAHDKLSGFIKTSGRLLAVHISGHMVNYVILSCFIPLDWSRLIDQIEWNMDLHQTRRALTKTELQLAKNWELAEFNSIDTIYDLWHNVQEWELGVRAGVIFAKYMSLEPDLQLMQQISNRFLGFSKKYPKCLSESKQVTKLRTKGFVNKNYISQEEIGQISEWLH